MIRISFRQSMLAGFLLIAFLLSWAAVQSWFVLEKFVERSRQGSEQALQLSASIQELAERTINLERSTRQFIILNDPVLLGRFDENAAQSLAVANRLKDLPEEALGKLPDTWRQTIEGLSQALHQSAPRIKTLSELTPYLNRLAETNKEMDHSGRRWIDDQHATMLAELEHNRLRLTLLIIATVIGAFLVALAMSWWLSRPIENIVRSIEHLGENKFDEPVTIRGPADLRRIGRRLDWLRHRLRELESDRERILRHVSHELKTPLTALREGIALLQDKVVGSLAESQQEVVDILQNNVLALQRHIESLLQLNAASFEARRLCYRPVLLKRLLADVIRSRELQIQARQLIVRCKTPAVTRSLDREKLLVVLDNLLSNAIDFSPEGGIIRLEAEVSDNIIRFVCIDQGPGIDAADVERIFEPFVQGSRASPTPRQGSGVGLSIVRELMTSMGGQVRLIQDSSDKKTHGAEFLIEVPCDQ